MPRDVLIGWVSPGEVSNRFANCLLDTVAYDRASGADRIFGWVNVECSANISSGRNSLVEQFLGCEADWLAQIDTDMVWQRDALHRLLEVADPVDRPIVGALCFGRDADTGLIWPTLYDLAGTEESPQFLRYDTWRPGELLRVVGTGAAFTVVHRSAMEAIRDRGFSRVFPWYQEGEMAGTKVGEDMTMCLRAGALGIPVHVHTGVTTGHLKRGMLTLDAYLAQRESLAQQAAELAERKRIQREYIEAAYPAEAADLFAGERDESGLVQVASVTREQELAGDTAIDVVAGQSDTRRPAGDDTSPVATTHDTSAAASHDTSCRAGAAVRDTSEGAAA